MTNKFEEMPVLFTGQMKSGGTLFRALMDGGDELFVFPDQPFFRLLSQRNYHSSQHRKIDWLINNRAVTIQPANKILINRLCGF